MSMSRPLTAEERAVRDELLEPEVKLEEGARIRLGTKRAKYGIVRFSQTAVKWAVVATLGYVYYNRKTMLEGGSLCRSKKQVLHQDLKLMDWYFHMLGKQTGFITTFQFQCQLPTGKTYDADELLTEFARGFMQSWPRAWEARERGLDEPMDAYTPDDLAKCMFRPPSGFAEQDLAAAKHEEVPVAATSVPWYKRLWDSSSKAEAGATAAAEGVVMPDPANPESLSPQAQGDVIGGYFVHRRAGQHTQKGSATYEETGSARSLVLAPDPWEERAYVLSCMPGNGYCTFRLHYATSTHSEYFPAEKGYLAEFYRLFTVRKHRLMTTAAGNYVEKRMLSSA